MLKKLQFESDFFSLSFGELVGTDFDKIELMPFNIVQSRIYLELEASVLLEKDFQYEDSRIELKKSLIKDIYELKYIVKKVLKKDIERFTDDLLKPLIEYSRFVSIVGKEATLEFYKLWAKNAVLGLFDDMAFVVEVDDCIVGIVTLKLNDDFGSIGILSVMTEYQGQGIGQTLLKYIENHLLSYKIDTLSIVTEGRNIGAQKFYINNKFNIENKSAWYYWRR